MEFQIEKMKHEDWEQVSKIYDEGIKTGNATFETDVPSWESWISKHLLCCNIVARRGNKILGWAAVSPTSSRNIYSGVTEVSIYVGKECKRTGVGLALLKELIELSENNGIWTLQAGIFPENKASINLHKKCGFKIVGIREKIGKMDDIWRDVVLMERRSNKVGIT
ncbi:N-acetyltransferase family protein [Methanobacterium sp.]|jgi:L-amino acid N-acyltransferase YncA|uniref:GNAT family N-acetyltransferase n=1 Tax=Methanobacterium sp. TaxID=2164 RepID=UPI00315805C0